MKPTTKKYHPVITGAWALLFLASLTSSMTGAYNQTESWEEPTRYFMVTLAAGCVLGSAVLIDRMRRDKVGGGFVGSFLTVISFLTFTSFVATSFTLDIVQIATTWQRGETENISVERTLGQEDTALEAAKAKAETTRLAVEGAPDLTALNAAVAAIQGQVAAQSEEVRLESLRGFCGPRCEEKKEILAGLNAELTSAVAKRDAAASERKALVDEAAAASEALAALATAQADDPTEKSLRGVARDAMQETLADRYFGFDQAVAVSFLLALAMNLGASTMYSWTYDEVEEAPDAKMVPIYSQAHMDQLLALITDRQLAQVGAQPVAAAPQPPPKEEPKPVDAPIPAPRPAAYTPKPNGGVNPEFQAEFEASKPIDAVEAESDPRRKFPISDTALTLDLPVRAPAKKPNLRVAE